MGEFLDEIKNYTVAEIVAALGCPRGTAYYWHQGRRRPPAWIEPLLLRALREFYPARRSSSRPRKS